MKTYKGLNKDFKCMGFQYKVGKTYSKETKPKLCTDKGFHSCENPLDVLYYYPPTSRFAECEISGDTDKKDSKICSQRITIKSEINLLKLVTLGIEYVWSKVNKGKKQTLLKDGSVASNSGDSSVASNSGDRSVASNSGDRSVASNSGYRSVASNSGDSSVASNSGNSSVASNSGYRSVASNSGNSSVASNSGNRSVASNSGDRSVASNSGNSSVASNSGDRSVASNSGNSSVAIVSSNQSIAFSSGFGATAKGNKGCWLVLAEHDDYNNIINVKSIKVDGKKIKANIFYSLVDNKFIEA